MNRRLLRISKFLSLVLRHKPQTVGLSLDQGGWAKVDEVLDKAKETGVSVTRELLQQVVKQSEKQRFSLTEDGLRIRANYGHSIPVDLGLEPLMPPEFLFHGTAKHSLDSIERQGIVPKKRNYVHLSPDKHTAVRVGKRHGKAIVLIIQAGRMYEHGFQFFRSVKGIWLTEKIPSEYIIFPK